MTDTPTKSCTRCKRELPATTEHFQRSPSGSLELSSRCKPCLNAVRAERKPQELAARQEPPPGTLQRCRTCGEEKPATTEHFSWSGARLKLHCKPCCAARVRAYNQQNAAQVSARRKERYWADPEKIRARNRDLTPEQRERAKARASAWYAENAERARERNRAYKQANPEVWKASNHKRRTTKKQAGGTFTKSDLKRQYAQQAGKCWWCGTPLGSEYHIDHRVPLSRGGTNEPSNIVLACADCNLRKNARLPHEWVGRLL